MHEASLEFLWLYRVFRKKRFYGRGMVISWAYTIQVFNNPVISFITMKVSTTVGCWWHASGLYIHNEAVHKSTMHKLVLAIEPHVSTLIMQMCTCPDAKHAF